jgi:hypothetical protein
MSSAIKKYIEFHQHEPRKVGFAKALSIPSHVICVGEAKNVLYRSDKLNPGTGEDEGEIDYIHDHSRGVHVYRCDRGAVGTEVAVPAFLRNARDIVKLGDCLGFEYEDADGDIVQVQGNTKGGLPELYTIANGKALLVIQSKRTIMTLIWGGKLGVERRGIVH